MTEPQTFDPSKPFTVVDAQAAPPIGAHPEARIGPAAPGTAYSPESVNSAGEVNPIGPKVRAFLNEPLARPTGIGIVDQQLSPMNLALTAGAAARPALRLVTSAAQELTARVGAPVVARLLKLVTPSILKKPAEIADLLGELGKAMDHSAAPAAAPAAPVATSPPAAVSPTIGEAAAAPIPVIQTAARTTPDEVLRAASERTAAPPPAAPVAAPPTNALPNQKLLNELAIEARRVGVKLTPEMEQTAIDAVGKGASPQQAVRAFAPLAPTEAAPAWTPKKPQLTAAEAKLSDQMTRSGKTDDEIRKVIEAGRAFQKRYGTPTPTAAQTRFPKGQRGKTGGD